MSARPELEKLSRTLHSNAIHLLRNLRQQDSALGIGPSQLSTLSVVVFGGPKPLHSLAQAEQVRPPTMSRIVDGLVHQGLARREANRLDRRSITIVPTQKGIQVMREGRDRREKKLIKMLEPLSPNEVKELQRASEILTKVLKTD